MPRKKKNPVTVSAAIPAALQSDGDGLPCSPQTVSSEVQHMCDACIHYDDTIDPCDPEAIPNEPCPHCTQYIRSGDDATNQWTPKAASRATVTDFHTRQPKREDDGKTCRNCVFSVLADDENEPLPFECAECTRSGLAAGTKDNWTDNGEESNLPGDPPDTTRITLTIISFSEDGETAQVEDRHGNQWELSTLDFLQDGDIDAGTTVLCYVQNSALAAEGCTLRPDEPEAREPIFPKDEPTPVAPPPDHGVTWLKRDVVRKALPLSDEDKLECGKEMADALAKIEDYEAELDVQRKHFKRLIEEQEKIAADAAKQFTEGLGPEEDITCDVYQDWNTNEVVYVEATEPFTEIMRRKMSPDEMQPTLFDKAPDAPRAAPVPHGDTVGTPHATNRRTCLDCGHMPDSENGTQAEECASCSQSGSGEADNWTPRRECRTCEHSHATIDLPPCAGCALNVMPEHRGDEDRWEWTDAAKENVAVSGPASDAGNTDNALGATEQEAHASV